MNVPDGIWDHIYARIRLVLKESVDEDSMRIRFELHSGGIKATIPSHLVDRDINDEQSNEDYTVTIATDLAYELHSEIYKHVEDSLIDTPNNSSINYYYFVLSKNELQMTILLTMPELMRESTLYTELSEILAEENVVDSTDAFSHAVIDTCHKNAKELWDDDFETWRFDGTVYFHTDKPYKYWSKGEDNDFPRDMREWYEFASEDNVDKTLLQTQNEQFRVHKHPTKWRIKRDHPYIEWYTKCKSRAMDKIEVANLEPNLRSVEINKSTIKYTVSLSQSIEY